MALMSEDKKDGTETKKDVRSGNVAVAQARIELALLKYKVAVSKGTPIAGKKVRL